MLTHRSKKLALKWSRARSVADYFRQQSFIVVVVLVAIPAWLWVGINVQAQRIDAVSGIALVGMILSSVGLVYRLYRTHYFWAVCTLLAAQILFITSMLWLMHDLTIGYLFVLVVVIAGSLIGPIGALATASGAAAIELALMKLVPDAIGASPVLVGLILTEFLAALVSGRASLGLHDALDSAEISAFEARKHAEEARRHRAELQRTLKSLDLAQAQLQRANVELFHAREVADAALRFKSEFTAQISHEFRTSLNLVLGFSETMAFAQHSYGAKLPAAYLRDVTEIYRNSRHLLALIGDILDLSKLEAGRMGLYREPVSLSSILREGTDIIRPLIETKGLELVLDLPQALPSLMLDRTRIRQVVLNLLSNAARVTAQGQIVVRAGLGEEKLVVQVSDTGPGIPPEDLKNIFEEFHQVDDTAGLSGSAGLGLAVSKRIVEFHGGRMWAESVVGEGSTFSFTFPLQESMAYTPVMRTAGPSPHLSQPAVVVIGEEESDEVELLQRHLEGYTLAVAPTWDEATRQVVQVSARAVIVNAPVDEVSAPESLSVPLIACPLPGPHHIEEIMEVDSFLYKPLTAQAIQAALRETAPTARSLLIVDDDPSAVRLIERMVYMAEEPYRIFRAYSIKEALARIRAQPPDAVVLDLVMPDDDSFSLISTLRHSPATAHIPIIVVSGYAAEEPQQIGPIGIVNRAGFTPTETLHYLQAILSAVPPAPVERYTIAPPLSAVHPV